jgi:hypothetical protein
VASLRRPLESGLRFALCWLLPALVVFSLISGKQIYYPLPELGGVALLMAGALAVFRERHPTLAYNAALGTWPLGLGGIVLSVVLFILPVLADTPRFQAAWLDTAAPYSRYFSVVFLLLGVLLLLRGRGELRRLAIAGLIGVLAINTLFTLSVWPRWDLRPTALLLGAAELAHRPIGYAGNYEGQFHFEGRLTQPITELYGSDAVQAFARAHADGLIVTNPATLSADAQRYALLAQPFRSSWLVVWPAATLGDLHAGHVPAEPAQPTQIYPADKSRTHSQP